MTRRRGRRRWYAVLVAVALLGGAVTAGTLGLRGPSGAEAARGPVEIDLRAPSRLPALPAEAGRNTEQGATQFVLWWFDVLNHSLARGDTQALASSTGAGCGQCAGWLIALQKWKDTGSRLEGGLTVPLELSVGPFEPGRPVQFAAAFLTSPATVTTAQGAATDYPGGRTRGAVTVAWVNERWQMTDVVVDLRSAGPRP